MEKHQAQNNRRKKILLLCENIALVIGWVVWIILYPIWILLLIFFMFSWPVIIDDVKLLIRYWNGKKGAKMVGQKILSTRKTMAIFVASCIMGGIFIIYSILALYFYWFDLTNIFLTLCLTGGFALLFYWGKSTQLDAEFALMATEIARKEMLRQRKLHWRNVNILFYSVLIGIEFGLLPYFNFIHSPLEIVTFIALVLPLFAICLSLTSVLVKVMKLIKGIFIAHLKDLPASRDGRKGVDLLMWAQETTMSVWSLRSFITMEIEKRTIFGSFNEQKTYFFTNSSETQAIKE